MTSSSEQAVEQVAEKVVEKVAEKTTLEVTPPQESIQSSTGLLAILLGLMVGFGNVWTLPQHVMQSGGMVYILVFVASMFVFGLPFIIAELTLGRAVLMNARPHTITDPIHGITELAKNSNRSVQWGLIGRLGLVVCAFLASLYSMVSGWSLAFLSRAISGQLTQDSHQAKEVWTFVSQHAEVSLFWYVLTMLLVVVILSRVLNLGLERYSKRLIMILITCVLSLVCLACMQGNWQEAIQIMTRFDLSNFDSQAVYHIILHCFYTLVLGTTAMFMLGAYASPKQSFTSIATQAIALDTILAILLCFVVLAFALSDVQVDAQVGTQMSSNFELIFIQVPSILAEQDWGQLSLVLFYTVIFIMGVMTCAVVTEPLVAWVSAQFNYSRLRSSRLLGIYISFISMGIAFSFSIWKDQKISLNPKIGDKIYTWFEDASFYSILTYITLDVLLPIGALLMIYFAGFVVKPSILKKQFTRKNPRLFTFWLFVVRNITPVLVFAVLLKASGLLKGIQLWFGWAEG